MRQPSRPFSPLSSSSPAVSFEALEGRVQLAAGFSTRIHFAPESAPAVRGYKLDYGAVYGRHGNGLTYGWNVDKRADAVYAESANLNPRGDAHVDMGRYDTWSIAVPDGYYSLKVLMGDPASLDGSYRIDAEGMPLVRGEPYPGFPFIEGLQTFHVTDGQLTITSADKEVNNRFCSIQISAADAPVATKKGATIDWVRDNDIESPIPRVESDIVRLPGKIMVMGGFVTDEYGEVTQRVDLLDLKTHTWTRLADLPEAQTHMATATDGRYVYTAGGQIGPLLSADLTADVWRYDLRKNVWKRFGKLPDVRTGSQMQLLGTKLHLVGGDNATRVLSQYTHFVFDLANPAAGWTTGAPLPTSTDHHTSIVVGGQMYVLGGEIDHGTSYITRDQFYRYDAKHDRWITLAPMPMGISHQEGSMVTDGRRIFVLGGQAEVQQLTNVVYSYDLRSGTWDQLTSMPSARKGGIAWLEGGTLYYVTGDDATYGQPPWAYRGEIGA